jgi:hypothetical protein
MVSWRFIAGLAGEIRIRHWRQAASMPIFDGPNRIEAVPE